MIVASAKRRTIGGHAAAAHALAKHTLQLGGFDRKRVLERHSAQHLVHSLYRVNQAQLDEAHRVWAGDLSLHELDEAEHCVRLIGGHTEQHCLQIDV